jgi:PASTA domain
MTKEPESQPAESTPPTRTIVTKRSDTTSAVGGPPITAPVTPLSGEPTTGFNAHAGEVMGGPRVFATYWGHDWGSPAVPPSPNPTLNARATNMDRFLDMAVTSRYVDMLAEYLVSHGTFLGSKWIDHNPAISEAFTFDQMTTILMGWLDAGVLPVVPAWNDGSLLFMIFPSHEITMTDNNGGTGFCGYHYWGHYHQDIPLFHKPNLFFAIDTNGDTGTVGHELAEAFTDRSGNGWFTTDGPGAEIGDVCSDCSSPVLDLEGSRVASYWLVSSSRCLQQSDLVPPPPPPPTKSVPNVVGQPAAAARTTLASAGFGVSMRSVVDNMCNSIGDVMTQSPRGGALAAVGSNVTIGIGHLPPHPCP